MKTSIWVCKNVETGELRTYDSFDVDNSEFVGGLDYWDDTPAQNSQQRAWYESTTPQYKKIWKLVKLMEVETADDNHTKRIKND